VSGELEELVAYLQGHEERCAREERVSVETLRKMHKNWIERGGLGRTKPVRGFRGEGLLRVYEIFERERQKGDRAFARWYLENIEPGTEISEGQIRRIVQRLRDARKQIAAKAGWEID
jgi:hypothetical protein